MPHFIFRWKFTGRAARHIITDPLDRSNLIKVMVKDFGGTLLSYYWTSGDFDGLYIAEFPSHVIAMAYTKAVEATEGFTKFELIPALTAEEAKAALQIAHDTQTAYFLYRASLHPPGAAPGGAG